MPLQQFTTLHLFFQFSLILHPQGPGFSRVLYLIRLSLLLKLVTEFQKSDTAKKERCKCPPKLHLRFNVMGLEKI